MVLPAQLLRRLSLVVRVGLLLALGAVVLLAPTTVVTLEYTAQPEFCITCHAAAGDGEQQVTAVGDADSVAVGQLGLAVGAAEDLASQAHQAADRRVHGQILPRGFPA